MEDKMIKLLFVLVLITFPILGIYFPMQDHLNYLKSI